MLFRNVSRMRRRTLPLIAASCLAGCAVAASSVSTNPCQAIPLRDYSREFNAELADEVDTAPPGARWPAAVGDYVALRDAVRACKSVTER